MFSDCRTKCRNRAVVACPFQTFKSAAVGFVSHPDCAVQTRIRIPVTRIKKIENVAVVIIPTVAVKRLSVGASENVHPFIGHGLRQIRIDRQRDRREKELRRLSVMVNDDLRIPFKQGFLQILRFLLRNRNIIAVEIETVMIISAPNRPRFTMFERGAVGVSGCNRVIPGCKTLVSVRVFARNNQDDIII